MVSVKFLMIFGGIIFVVFLIWFIVCFKFKLNLCGLFNYFKILVVFLVLSFGFCFWSFFSIICVWLIVVFCLICWIFESVFINYFFYYYMKNWFVLLSNNILLLFWFFCLIRLKLINLLIELFIFFVVKLEE